MSTTRFFAALYLVGLVVSGASVVYSQDYPSKIIRIVTSNPGSGSDFNAREVAKGLSGLGQPVIVDNRVGSLVGEIGAKAPPDGYNVTVAGANLWLGPLLQKFNYSMGEFSPITLISREVKMLAVHPSVPVKSTKELIAMAKAKPKELLYATSTPGGASMLGLELLKSITNVQFLEVPYKTGSRALIAVMTGESHITIGDMTPMVAHARSGRVRVLAVTSVDATTLAPGMPTVAAAGFPGFDVTAVTAMLAPAKTPAPIITKLNQEVVRYFNRPDIKERFLDNQLEVVVSSPEQLATRINSDLSKWGKIFNDAGIKPQ